MTAGKASRCYRLATDISGGSLTLCFEYETTVTGQQRPLSA